MNEIEMRKLSVLASWLTAPHVRKPKKPTDFYNPNKTKEKPKTSPEKTKRMIDDLENEMGGVL
jgi:hypothetical protein